MLEIKAVAMAVNGSVFSGFVKLELPDVDSGADLWRPHDGTLTIVSADPQVFGMTWEGFVSLYSVHAPYEDDERRYVVWDAPEFRVVAWDPIEGTLSMASGSVRLECPPDVRCLTWRYRGAPGFPAPFVNPDDPLPRSAM